VSALQAWFYLTGLFGSVLRAGLSLFSLLFIGEIDNLYALGDFENYTMRRFYLLLLIFIFPICVFMGLMELYVRNLPNIYKYKNDWMERHAEEVETLVLGSSHTLGGINPEYLDGCSFNLANQSQTLKYDHFLFFKWADRYKKLKVVILPISYFTFFFSDMEQIRKVYYTIYMDYPNTLPDLEMLYYLPLKIKINQFMKGEGIGCCKNGWARRLLSGKDYQLWNKDYVTKLLVHKQTAKSWKWTECNYNYVCEMASYCRNHGIRLVLVAPPHPIVYNRYLSKKQLAKTDSILMRLQRDYSIEYHDYRCDNRFVDDDFIDQSHLSEIGAGKFTKRIAKDILLYRKE
jgi:hypothetical protein